ncbi:MAG TPA: helix-turn-helix domain-containing protein [Dehalococcoidales bacterium]|nr:helix-turn-helix domain-containing protein [Dehalococcoidales bacterium]
MERVTITVNDILTPTKAAAYLGIARMTLWRWVRDGKITPVMLDHAYFHLAELTRVKALRDDQGASE